MGFYFVILLTGLSGIPSELYEAAMIDGATRLQLVRYITLPLLRNSICTCIVLAVTGALKVFDLPWTMFVNGMSNTWLTGTYMYSKVYTTMFVNGMSNTWLTGTYMYSKVYTDVDYASAIAVVIVILGVVLSFAVNHVFKQKDDYAV